MTRRARAATLALTACAVLAVAVVAVAVVGRAAIGANGPASGPLDTGSDVTATGFAVDPGEPFSYGYLFLRNPSAATIVLDRVELVGSTPGLHVLGMLVISLRHATQGVAATSRGFPPSVPTPYPYRPLAGSTLAPSQDPLDTLDVQVGLKVDNDGDYFVREIAVDYHIGHQDYRKVVPYALHFCAPLDERAHSCASDARAPST